MEHQAIRSVYYPTLAGGMRRRAPPRTLTPQTPPHFFRNMLNLVAHDGLLRRREGLTAVTTINLVNNIVRHSTGNDQFIQGIFQFSLSGTARAVIVTDKELWLVTSNGLQNATPTYSTGTVTATNGLTAITGAGTAWKDDNVGDDVLILLEGTWYQIDTVTSNTAATLTSAYAGAGGAGLAYTIKRSFWGLKEPTNATLPYYGVHASAILDDVYVAGVFGRYYDSGNDYIATGAVLRINGGADPQKTTFTGADVEYLFSSQDMDGAGTMDTADRRFYPLGLEVHEDGRLLLPAHHAADSGGDPAGQARLWYSSFDDYKAWTLSPGGSSDQIQRKGKMTAIGPMGRSFALHFDDQILLASPTGSADPPLSVIRSRAQIGAAGPRLRIAVPGGQRCPAGEFFLASDGHAYVFNGDSALEVDAGWHEVLADYRVQPDTTSSGTVNTHGFLGYDGYRREVSLFFPDTVSAFTNYYTATIELRWNIDTGAMSRHRYAIPITAMAQQAVYEPMHATVLLDRFTKQFGTRTLANGVTSAGIYNADATKASDGAPVLVAAETPGACWCELDDQDFGSPDHYWKPLWVFVWVVGEATTTETLKCRLSSDDGASFVERTQSVSLTLGLETLVVFNFEEAAPAAGKWKVRVQSNDNDTLSMAFRGAKLFAVPASDARAV